MKVSTRGRYALRVMIDLAEHISDGFVPLKDIAERQEISQKYLESITKELSNSALIISQHGKGGGYKLSKSPDDYTILEILSVVEGDMAPISCLSKGNNVVCNRANVCKSLVMWQGLYKTITDYLDNITLASLAQGKDIPNWVI